MSNTITINARKFNGSIHRSWNCQLLEQTETYWLFVGEFEQEVVHSKLGIIRPKTKSYEYYFKEKWFNIFRFHEPEGELKYYYCNLNLPPTFNNNVLDYVDLDIDVLVYENLSYQILDEDEFEENIIKYQYKSDLISEVRANLLQLISRIKQRQFPFDLIKF